MIQRKVSDCSQNPPDHLNHVHQTGQIEILTENGEAKGVVMSAPMYEKLMEEVELARSVTRLDSSFQNIQFGRTQPMRDALHELTEEFGEKQNSRLHFLPEPG